MKHFLIFPALIFLFTALKAQPDSINIDHEVSYTSDIGLNIRGGYDQGLAWMGQFNARVDLNLNFKEKWGAGFLHMDYMVTHGTSLSSMLGDIQVASNIEAPPMATFFEFWYEHRFSKHRIKFGLIDMNSEFLFTEQALPLLNSSFGIQPTLSVNMPLSIFPLSAPGIVWETAVIPRLRFSIGIFDGKPSMKSGYQPIPDVTINRKDGLFIVQETGFRAGSGPKPVSVKIGAWVHTGQFESHATFQLTENYGGYMILDKALWQMGEGMLYGWVKTGLAPGRCNVVRNFNGAGFTYHNPFGLGDQDFIAMAFGNAVFCKDFLTEPGMKKHETSIELTLRKQWRYFAVQPDIQYILNPSGYGNLKNPVCLIFRVQASL